MEKAVDAAVPEEKETRGWGGLLGWAAGILLLYFLSILPLLLMVDRNLISASTKPALERIYSPVEWAYSKTLLHRPIGMYLHLWSKRFDTKGNQH